MVENIILIMSKLSISCFRQLSWLAEYVYTCRIHHNLTWSDAQTKKPYSTPITIKQTNARTNKPNIFTYIFDEPWSCSQFSSINQMI